MHKTTIALSILASMIVPQSSSIPITNTTYNSRKQDKPHYILDRTIPVGGTPVDINVHFKTGDVYFTLITPKSGMAINRLNPNGEVETINSLFVGQSTAIDNNNDIIYIATNMGIVRYDKEDNESIAFTAYLEDVTYASVGNNGSVLYITTWPYNKVHKITIENLNTTQKSYPYVTDGHGLTVDKKNNIYFIDTHTLYILKDGGTKPIKITGVPYDTDCMVSVAKDGGVYAVDENGDFYMINADNAYAKKLYSFNIEDVKGFAIDAEDNLIIGVNNSLLIYKKS